MHKLFIRKVLVVLLASVFFVSYPVSTFATGEGVRSLAVDFLLQAGMPLEEVDALDPKTREFIVNNLIESGVTSSELEYLETDLLPSIEPRTNQLLTGVSYTVSAFRSGNRVFIYPTYEFTTARRPRGNDSFAVSLGDALRPFNYGGQLWFKDPQIPAFSNWTRATCLSANTQHFSGGAFSGTQLGSPDWPIFFRGNTFIHAEIGPGSDRSIIMSYMYNPNRNNFNVSFSIFGFGLSFTASSGQIWTSSSSQVLNF